MDEGGLRVGLRGKMREKEADQGNLGKTLLLRKKAEACVDGQKIDLEPVTFLIPLPSRNRCGTDMYGHFTLIMPDLV